MGGRRFNRQRLAALIAYVSLQLGKDFTVERVLWIVFHADMEAYRLLGQSITGATWVKTSVAPLPMSKREAAAYRRRLNAA